MKKFTLLFLLFGILVSSVSFGQIADTKNSVRERCGTMQLVEQLMQENPDMRRRMENAFQDANNLQNNNRNGTYQRTGVIVTIPVVFHVVLPNPNIVTDADLRDQIDRLNRDYAGTNSDSTNAGPFASLRGHSEIRFCMAQRTPGGALTNGIERRASATGYTGGSNDPIKSTAAGGLDAWDPNSYLNIWVGLGGLLGYATFPGTGAANQQGVVIDLIGTGANSCYADPAYDLGRSLTHEVGHYLGLFHTFQGACGDQDFFDLSAVGSTYTLVGAGLPGDDTPATSAPQFGCPTGMVNTGCASPNPPGKMYQNFMDYTDDACMTMFSLAQAARAEYVLNNFRASLATSLGCVPPAGAITLDASAYETVSPGGYELSGCNVLNYPSNLACGGSFTAKFRIRNNGTTTLTSVGIGYRLDNNPATGPTNVAVNIPSGGTAVVSLGSVSVSPGAHVIRYYSTAPNGGADQVPANDTIVVNFNVATGSPLPVSENFTGTTFPPSGWTLTNPDNGITWARSTVASFSAPASARIDFYNYFNTGQKDILVSPALDLTGVVDSLVVNFRVAHAGYGAGFGPDSLEVVYSTDCGVTWTRFDNYLKWTLGPGNSNLSTAPNTTGSFAPNAAQWRLERLAVLPSSLPGSPASIMIGWRSTTGYGNNLFIDDINIEKKVSRDLRITAVLSPSAEICATGFVPQAVVNNNGQEAVTSFDVTYSVNGGALVSTSFTQTINPGSSATVTLPAATGVVGNNTIVVATANPVSASGTGDQSPGNDAFSHPFTVNQILNAPITQGFESPAFPPAGWQLLNPQGNITWIRRAPGNNSGFSMFIDNYNYSLPGQIDELKSPTVNTNGLDSIIFMFDLAARYYSATLADTLSVYASTDCGVTYTAVYKKWGPALGAASTAGFLNPGASDWRTERIALGDNFVTGNTIIFKIRNTNRFGNNIFVDNVNILAVYGRDAALTAINQPTDVICAPNFSPTVTVENRGTQTMTGVSVAYSINGGTPVTKTFTGLSLGLNASTVLTLDPATVPGLGSHTFKAWTFDPVTATGTGDPNPTNDTLTKTFVLAGTTSAPLNEGFEGATFPPTGWARINPDGGITWDRSSSGRNSSGSAYINTYNYSTLGSRDDLYSPNITYNGVDSVSFTFDVAAVTYSYPGSTSIPLDTLEVLVTTDCGTTFTTIYKKWGEDLQTINDPNYPQTAEFFPTSPSHWRRETIDLTAFAPDGPIQLVFRSTSNFENNIFVDNVNVSTRTLPARLKNDGFMILPTPFFQQFTVWHWQTPTSLRYVTVYNSAGQLVWSKQFSGDAAKQITVDLRDKASGVYIVNLGYDDANRNVQQRVVKH